MPFRLAAFGIHLCTSLALVSLVLAALYAGWYRWPAWYLTGAETVVGLLVLVDLGLGPLATAIVAHPAKARPVFWRDVAVIAAVQFSALGYGAYTLWAARPLFYVLSLDRIEVVPASAFRDETVAAAREQGASILPAWHALPRWIWAPLPADPVEQKRIVMSAVLGGDDVVTMPQYFRPWAHGRAALLPLLIPVDRLAGLPEWEAGEYARRVTELRRPPGELGALPVTGSRRAGTWIFDRATGEPLAYWPVETLYLAR